AGVRYTRDFIATRSPEQAGKNMSRLYAVESTPSVTGSMADHHLALETPRRGRRRRSRRHRRGGAARALAGRPGAGPAGPTRDFPGRGRHDPAGVDAR